MHDFHLLTWLFNVKTTLVLALIAIFLNTVSKILSRDPKWVQFAAQLPGPYAYPLIGNTFELMIGARNGFTPLFKRYIKTYGRTFRLWFGHQLVVVLSDPKDVQTVLQSSSCLGKPDILTQVYHEYFGKNLAFAIPSVWKQKRSTYQPFFNQRAVLSCIPSMNKLIYEYIEEMKKHVDGPEFNFKFMMNNISLETILKTHTGYQVDKARREELQVNVVRNVSSALEKTGGLMICYWEFLKMIFNVILPIDMLAMKKLVYDFVDEILSLHQKSSEVGARNLLGIEDEEHNSDILAQSYLNSFTTLKEKLGEEDIVYEELIALFLGSIETTGAATAACIFALATHPDVQEKVYQEIHEVFGDDERPVQKSDYHKFPYLEQVIKESRRLYTLIPAILRDIPEGTKIGDYVYPGGTAVMISIGGIHHNPEIYPNPDRFNPENFSPEAVSKRHKFSFIPCSAGARNCLGKAYAEVSLKLRMIGFVRTFTFHTTKKLEDITLRPGLIEESAIGFPISVKLRKKLSQNQS